MPATVQLVDEAAPAAALLSPLRRRILELLREPDSAAGVARELGLPRQRVNYHVRALEKQGLLEPMGQRNRGNCTERLVRATARHYLIAPQAVGALAADPDALRDRFSAGYLAALAGSAIRDLARLEGEAEDAGRKLPTLSLQTEVRFASPSHRKAFAEELTSALARLARKYHQEDAPGGRTFRLFLGAYPSPAPAPEERQQP